MPVPPGFTLVSYIFSGPSAGPGGCMTTIGVEHTFTESPTFFAGELFTAFENEIMPGLTSTVTLSECRIRAGTVGGEITASHFGSAEGGEAGSSMPPNIAVPVTKFSALGGRKNRGRMFLPGVAEGHVGADGVLSGAVIEGFNSSLGAFMTELEAIDATPHILHSDPEDAPTEIIALVCGTVIYTRGSRLRG